MARKTEKRGGEKAQVLFPAALSEGEGKRQIQEGEPG